MPVFFTCQCFLIQFWLVGTKGVHTKGEYTLWEEITDVYMMLRGQILNQVRHLPDKPELLHVVYGVRHTILCPALVKCDIGQIGDVAMQGHRESDLNILAAETFVTE